MASVDIDARLDLIAFANRVRVDVGTPVGDADLMAYLVGELCDKRDSPASDCLTHRRAAVLRAHDADFFAELAKRHGWCANDRDDPQEGDVGLIGSVG